MHSDYLSTSFDIIFRRAVWNQPITTDTCRCLFHVTFMQMSHKFRRSRQWAVIGGFRSVLFAKLVKRWMAKDIRYARNTESGLKDRLERKFSGRSSSLAVFWALSHWEQLFLLIKQSNAHGPLQWEGQANYVGSILDQYWFLIASLGQPPSRGLFPRYKVS